MTQVEQQNHSYWLSAFSFGTLLNIFLFLLLPQLGHSEKPAEPMVIALDFIAWQEPVKQSKSELPKPTDPKKPKPKLTKKVTVNKPKYVEKPILTEKIELPKQETTPLPPTEEFIEERQQEVLPQPVPIFKVTSLPRVVHWEKPEYPPNMKALSREATVKVEVLIDNIGLVRQINLIKSGGVEFDKAAIFAVEHSSFLPAKIDGRAVPVRYRIPIQFRLN